MSRILLRAAAYTGVFCLAIVGMTFMATLAGGDIHLAVELAVLQAMFLGLLLLLIAIMMVKYTLPFLILGIGVYLTLVVNRYYERRRAGD